MFIGLVTARVEIAIATPYLGTKLFRGVPVVRMERDITLRQINLSTGRDPDEQHESAAEA
jgi:hypothetical protein